MNEAPGSAPGSPDPQNPETVWPQTLADLPEDSPLRVEFGNYLARLGAKPAKINLHTLKGAPKAARTTAETLLYWLRLMEQGNRSDPTLPLARVRFALWMERAAIIASEKDTHEYPLSTTEEIRTLTGPDAKTTIPRVVKERETDAIVGHMITDHRDTCIAILTGGVRADRRGQGYGEALLHKEVSKLASSPASERTVLTNEDIHLDPNFQPLTILRSIARPGASLDDVQRFQQLLAESLTRFPSSRLAQEIRASLSPLLKASPQHIIDSSDAFDPLTTVIDILEICFAEEMKRDLCAADNEVPEAGRKGAVGIHEGTQQEGSLLHYMVPVLAGFEDPVQEDHRRKETWLIATRRQGKAVGFCVYDGEGEDAEIRRFSIIPHERGHGVGAELAAEFLARVRGVEEARRRKKEQDKWW